jgi:hypothetical protein
MYTCIMYSMLWISKIREILFFIGLFCTDRARRARFVQKDRGHIFLCNIPQFIEHTKQARLIILVAWYTFGRIPMYSFFFTKNHSQIGMTSNNLTIFITLNITIVRQNKTKIVNREIMWADSTPGICGRSYFADLRMTFRQKIFLQDWFRNKFGLGLG